MMYLQNTQLCAPFTINISLNCTCQANWMATTSQTNISESFNSIHISSTLSDLFQFVSFLSQRESNGFAAGHAGQPKTKWVMRRVQATKPWPEWKILSVTCANSNTKTWETQKHERTLCCAIPNHIKLYSTLKKVWGYYPSLWKPSCTCCSRPSATCHHCRGNRSQYTHHTDEN